MNIDLLDPMLEAMLDSVLLPGIRRENERRERESRTMQGSEDRRGKYTYTQILGLNANVSVEFNFIPFIVDESEMDHHWHPGPMDVDYLDGILNSRLFLFISLLTLYTDDGEDKDEDDEGETQYRDEDYGEEIEEDIEGELDEEDYRYDYSSQRDFDEADEDDEDDEERDEIEDGYDEGDEDVEEEDDEEDEEDEDEDEDEDVRLGFIDDSVLANYGSLGWSICHNISDRMYLSFFIFSLLSSFLLLPSINYSYRQNST